MPYEAPQFYLRVPVVFGTGTNRFGSGPLTSRPYYGPGQGSGRPGRRGDEVAVAARDRVVGDVVADASLVPFSGSRRSTRGFAVVGPLPEWVAMLVA
jgi:hypothetical protein